MIPRPPLSELLGTLALMVLGTMLYLVVLWVWSPIPTLLASSR